MYILQICDTFTKEVLHHEIHDNPNAIENLIEVAKDWQECYIYDDKMRSFKGSYLNHSIVKKGSDTIYQLFFIVTPIGETKKKYPRIKHSVTIR